MKAAWLPTLQAGFPGDNSTGREEESKRGARSAAICSMTSLLHLVAYDFALPAVGWQTRITGTVKLHVVIEKNGCFGKGSILSGHPPGVVRRRVVSGAGSLKRLQLGLPILN